MTEIEKMKKYIEENKIQGKASRSCDMTTKELLALATGLPAVDAAIWAFAYGCAKGYRAAKAEVRA